MLPCTAHVRGACPRNPENLLTSTCHTAHVYNFSSEFQALQILILIPTGSLSAIRKMNYFFSAFAYCQLWLPEVIGKETRQCSMSVL